jgi:lipoprotein-releasing system permease protein
MIHTLSFFAVRYLWTTDKKSPLAALVKLCFWSIMLGTFFLTLIAAIIQGFQHATYTTLQNIHADLVISAPHNEHLNFDAINQVLTNEFPEIQAAAPRASSFVIVKNTHQPDQHVVTLQALDPEHETATTNVQKTICKPTQQPLAKLMHGTNIVIGTTLADNLALAIGDPVTLYYAPNHNDTAEALTFSKCTVTIGGIFATGITDYDANVAWASYDLFDTLFEETGTSAIGLKLAPTAHAPTVTKRLKQRLGLDAVPWYHLYPALVQALELEHHALLIVLILIVALASLTMAATLMLHMEQKKTDIALLRAMGMSMTTATSIFVVIGLVIASTATMCGMLSGLIASILLDTYKLISLPDAYYISHVPAHLTPAYFFLLFALANSVSFLVVWFTVRKGRMLSLSAVLRQQA